MWDTLLIKASSPEADSMQTQTQTYAEKVRQEGRGHIRGPPFVWAYLSLIKSLQQRGNAVGARTAQGIAAYLARLEPLSPMQICTAQGLSTCWARLEPLLPTHDEARFCRLDKIALNIVSPENRLLLLWNESHKCFWKIC